MSDCKVTTPVTLDELKAICRAQRIAGLREAAKIAEECIPKEGHDEYDDGRFVACILVRDAILARIAELEKP